MGFVNLQTSFAPLLLLKEMKLKKRNTDGVVPPRYVLTQGSLHYRLATLGYQKQKAMGFVNLQTSSAGAPLSLERGWG